jgi:hypothetical protein
MFLNFKIAHGAIKRVSEFQNFKIHFKITFKLQNEKRWSRRSAKKLHNIVARLFRVRSCFDLLYTLSTISSLSFITPCRQHLESLPFVLASSSAKRASPSHRRPTARVAVLAQSHHRVLASMVLFCGAATPKACRRVFFGLASTVYRKPLLAVALTTITIKIIATSTTLMRNW